MYEQHTQVNTHNLERVRRIKGRLVRLTTRVETVCMLVDTETHTYIPPYACTNKYMCICTHAPPRTSCTPPHTHTVEGGA